nr:MULTISPECIES: TRAP transporter substrate-binding protein DctP [unclassified Minwuia]
MANTRLTEYTAVQMLAGFAAGSLTPNAVLEACLSRISEANPRINALTAFDTERAVAEADASTRRWQAGTPRGILDGLPIGVKDLQDTEGLLTTYGSLRMRDHVPTADLLMVARLRKAGAIVLAKTNVPEMGAGGNSRNPVWGATGNPFNPNLIAGGSSGGSAAALAADMLPLCTGSDTGGSLRLPAALCGIVGYRPSADVIAHPARPLGWSGISVLGPMARDVDDLVLMLRACHGHDADDPLSSPADPARFDISLGLQTGVIDGYLNSPFVPVMFGQTDFVKNFSDAGVIIPIRAIIASKQWYDGLSDAERATVNDAVAKANAATQAWLDKASVVALTTLEDAGVTVQRLSEEEKEAFRELSQPVYRSGLLPEADVETWLAVANKTR